MLGGDPNSIKQIRAALAENPPMPVVVFEGSGTAADLLAYAVRFTYYTYYNFSFSLVFDKQYLSYNFRNVVVLQKCTVISKTLIQEIIWEIFKV